MNCYEFIRFCNGGSANASNFLFIRFSPFNPGSRCRYVALWDSILSNPFVTGDDLTLATSMFCKAQRVRNTLVTAIRRRRSKRIQEISSTNTDLSLDPLDQYPAHHKVVLETAISVHEFFIGDLLRHWRSQLLSQEWRRPTPRNPTNPYTNLKVDPATFLRVYCIAQEAGFRMHDTLTMLYRASGDLPTFKVHGWIMLQEWAVYTHVQDADVDELYGELLDIKQSWGTRLTNITVSDQAPAHVRAHMVTRLHTVISAYLMWMYSVNPMSLPSLRKRFKVLLTRVNAAHAGSRYGRPIKMQVRGQLTTVWLT
jgi:hypothetical protein